jgi:SNF2 family DNA or RNA helicase
MIWDWENSTDHCFYFITTGEIRTHNQFGGSSDLFIIQLAGRNRKICSFIKGIYTLRSGKGKKHYKNGEYEIVLTTYGMVLSDIRFLKNFRFNYIFLDESQAIKNPNSERYKAARLLQSRNRIVLTGTPVENNTFDLYGQLSFACPGLLGSKQYFKDIYAIPIDKFEYSKRALELQQKIKPFILRRTKKQVASELPEKQRWSFIVK